MTETSPRLRRADAADAALLVGFIRELWLHEGIPFTEARVAGPLQELLRNPQLGRVFVVEVDGEAAGYAVLGFGFSLEYGGRDAFLDELYLAPTQRGRRLGSRVLELLEEAAREAGIHALHLEVGRENAAGRALYARRGFADQDRLLLTKRIAAPTDPPTAAGTRP